MKLHPLTVRFKETVLDLFGQMADRFNMEKTVLVREAAEARAETLQPMFAGGSLIEAIKCTKRAQSSDRRLLIDYIREGLETNRYDTKEHGWDEVTPLMEAARGDGDLELVALLLEHGAEVDATCSYKNTAFTLSVGERGGAGDWNLAVSELLLRHGANPFHSTYMFTGRDAYWWAEQHDLLGTQRIIRSYVQEQNIDDLLGRVALNQRFEAITWFRYVQGADLASIPLELQSYGAKREDIWYQLKSLGIWRKRLKKLRQEGLDNAVIAVELIDGLYAHWADVAQAFAAEGLTPEAIVELLLPIVDASVPPEEENREGVLNCRVAWTAAAAFYEEEGSLVPVREVLERFGFDPNGVIHAMPYSEERRQEIRQRMGLLAAGGGQS